MKIVTPEAMAVMDRETIAHGIADYELMEKAGARCFRIIEDEIAANATVCVLCGSGNNGGDGQVIARLLIEAGHDVTVCFAGDRGKLTANAATNYQRLTDIGARPLFYDKADANKQNAAIFAAIDQADVIVDAVFGNGLKDRELYAHMARLFHAVNAAAATVYAIDIPSGLRGDVGLTVGAAIAADRTLVIQCVKTGLLLNDGPDYAGKITVVDVGIDESYAEGAANWLDADTLPKLPPRRKNSHKYHYGALSVIAGNIGMLGAGLMASSAALKSGAGLVTHFVPEGAYAITASQMPWEIMVSPYSTDNLIQKLQNQKTSAFCFGPGIGRKVYYASLTKWLVGQDKPVVIDADGLYHLAQVKAALRAKHAPLILTPHVGEFARLAGVHAAQIASDPIGIVRDFVKTFQVVLVLKGHHTIIAYPDGVSVRVEINSTGNAGMATAGSGDVLAGIIAGLVSQTETIADAACLGVYLHGLAGDLARDALGELSLTATDIIRYLPQAIHDADIFEK